MNLASQLTALKRESRDLTLGERAKLSCRLAKQLEKAGQYEGAWEALTEFWPERDGPLKLEGLDQTIKADVLLRVGALAGWLGSAHQTAGSQERAKNLLTQSVEIFEELGQSEGAAEARADLGLCYWREGALDEARIHLESARAHLTNGNTELKAVVLIRMGMVEVAAQRLDEAMRLLNESSTLVDEGTDHSIKGTFHNNFAVIFYDLGIAQHRDDYVDRALIEYTAASFHFEQAGHTRFQACVENNLGALSLTLGRFADAHQHLGRAGSLFIKIGDEVHLAQVNDTRAQTFLAEGRLQEAERSVRSAVKTLERGGEQALLAEALTTQGIVVARMGNYSRSKALLDRAVEVAEMAGDLDGAGRAKLSFIEELAEQTSSPELASIYQSAADLLQRSQDPSAGKRLISCARKVIDILEAAQRDEDSEAKEQSWEGFSFKQEVLKSEGAIIERALRDAGGSVTRAARLLGFRHHQNLISIINSRHKELLKTRSAVRKRRQHLFSKPRKIKRKVTKPGLERATSQISVLHVEDDEQIAKLVHEIFAGEEWVVELCADGHSALEKLTGNDHYDVLVVDDDLPGLSGIELVERARKMRHRHRTPIVMLSGSNCETQAWGAGVQAFLRKPEQISELPSTINRLLEVKD